MTVKKQQQININEYITLTSTEIDELKKRKREEQRIARLLSVREQAKQHAAKVRENYQKRKHGDSERKLSVMKVAWNEKRNEEVKIMKEEIDERMRSFGRGYLDANQTRREDFEKAQANLEILQRCADRQSQRYDQALSHERFKEYKRQEPMIKYKAIQKQIRSTEAVRSQDLVEKQRRIDEYNGQESSNFKKPIDRTYFSDIDRMINMREDGTLVKDYETKEKEKIQPDYRSSYFHMKSTDPEPVPRPPLAPVSKQVNPHVIKHINTSTSAIDTAKSVTLRSTEKENDKEELRRQQQVVASQRSQLALEKVRGENMYRKLTEEMKLVERIDRKYKSEIIPMKYVKSIPDRKAESLRSKKIERAFESAVSQNKRYQSPVEVDRTPKQLEVLYSVSDDEEEMPQPRKALMVTA